MKRFKLDKVNQSMDDLEWTQAYAKNPVIAVLSEFTTTDTVLGGLDPPGLGESGKGTWNKYLLQQIMK